jgi:hypothetical protein
LFGHTLVTSFTLLIVPIAVQEIVLAAWLIFSGFTLQSADPGPPPRSNSTEQRRPLHHTLMPRPTRPPMNVTGIELAFPPCIAGCQSFLTG